MSTIEKRDEAIDLARYKQAAEEIETGNRDNALWYKAFAEGGGDENATKAAYIRSRVEQLRQTAQQDAKEVLLDPVKRAAYDARIIVESAQPEKGVREISSGNSKTSASVPLSKRELYAAYLGGKNQDYYLNKFEQFDRLGDGMHMSWNWPAFITFLFGATWWALYRKLYAWFFALLVYGAILLAMINSRIDAIAAFAFVFSVASATAFGMFANVIYYRRVKGKIAAAQRVASDDDLIELLIKKGGVHSWVWWILWVWLSMAVIGIIAAIAIPAYSDYTKKAKAQIGGDVPQFASDLQRQTNQPLNQDAVEQAPRVTTSTEKEQIAAREESEQIKWLFEAKNYEGIVQEFTSGKKFFFSDFGKIGAAFHLTGRHAQAVDILLQAEKYYPNDSLIKNDLGNSYTSLGDYSNALTKYLEAENLSPNDSVVKSNMGVAYYASGDSTNALIKYRAALALDPYNHYAQKGIKAIETKRDAERQVTYPVVDVERQKKSADIICNMPYGACR